MTTFNSDKSSFSPGPMGWGPRNEIVSRIKEQEAREFDLIVKDNPKLLQERPAKDIKNTELWKTVQELMKADGIEDGFSFRYLEQAVWDKVFTWLKQLIGSCVGSGAMRAHCSRSMAEILLLGQGDEFLGTALPDQNTILSIAMFAPWAYGKGRELGNFDDMSDGSYCAVQARAMGIGNLPCSAEGLGQYTDAFPEPQNTNTYRLWGSSNYRSIRKKFEEIAKQYPVTESVKIQNSEDCKRNLIEGFKPMLQCSDWGFGPAKKIPGSDLWVYTRTTSWAHNMTRQGYLKINGNWYVDIRNSWGEDAHKNGDFFLVSQDEDERWIKDSEVQTIGELTLPKSTPVA